MGSVLAVARRRQDNRERLAAHRLCVSRYPQFRHRLDYLETAGALAEISKCD